MTPARIEAKLQGQSAIARKVFASVPVQEAWSATQIHAAIQRVTRSGTDFRILQGCLVALKAAGLISEPRRALFQREQIRGKVEEIGDMGVPANAVAMTAAAKGEAVEILSGLSGRMAALGAELAKIAADVETAAILLQEQLGEKDAALVKFNQLQSILKSLA